MKDERKTKRQLIAELAEMRRRISQLEVARAKPDKIEDAPQDSKQILAAVVSSVTDYMSMIDENYNVVWANHVAKGLFGSNIVGKKCYTAYHGRGKPCQPCIVKETFVDGKVHEHEMKAIRASGHKISFWCIASVAESYEDGRPKLVVEIFRDITDRKKTECELLRARKEAEAASRAKSEFLANMSHEIRTPLNAIMGFAQLLDEDADNPLPDNQREFLGYILSSGESLLRIIDDILDLSKIEAGKITLENTECSLKEMINELHKIFKQRVDEKRIELRISYGKDLSDKVLSDPTRLRQILFNLIGNAIKFTENGYVEIGIQKGNGFPQSLEFYVRDTGIGIPQEKIESIFNPFEQVDGSATRKYGGTGLGLAIVSRLITLMGGEIKVVSQLGKGSTFYFQIPCKPVEGKLEEGPRMDDMSPQVSDEARKYILVAEDNYLSYRLIEFLLNKKGFEVVRARNGEDAVSIYKTKREEICLILMDVNMPVLGGLEATKVIRKYNNKIPIIALTAHAMKGDRERFLEAGCTEYICKPLKQSKLFKKIEQCIR